MRRCKGIAALVLLVLLYVPMAYAQLSIEVQDVETAAFPDVTANVIVRQGGVIVRSTDSSNFKLVEDGFKQSPLHLIHPLPTKSFSMSIVIAVGSTMTAGDVAFAKGLASRLVERLDGLLDEAAVITYDGNALELQAMTSIKPILLQRIDGVAPTGGSNFIWDGGYFGVSYLLNNGTHPSRTTVILSNGKGDGGARDVQQVIDLAKAGGVKVHCYGINAVTSDSQMRQLCQETGGTYYTNTDLMVQELIDDLNGTPAASALKYRSDNLCRDGQARSLNVQVKMVNDSVNATFSAPLAANSSGNVTLTIKTDTATIVSDKTKEVALLISPAVQSQRLYGGTISLSFDTSILSIEGVTTTGHLAEGLAAAVAMTASGADVTLTGASRLIGSGALLTLTFKGAAVQTNTDVQVQVSSVVLDRGCVTAQTGSARITVRPQTASLSTKAGSVVFNWDGPANRYSPDPAVLTVEVTNNGDLPLSGIEATLEQSSDVRVAYGGSLKVGVEPSSLAPGDKGIATWYVQAQPQASEKTAQINAQITSAEGAGAQQRLFLNIKAATSAVAMLCEADVITVTGGIYSPDPAVVRAVLTSAGTNDSPAGDVTITLPMELTLDGGPVTQSFTAMTSGDNTTLHWPIRYPQPAVRTDYPITLVRSAAGYPSDTCHVMLTVPVLTAAQLDATCSVTPQDIDSTVTEVTYSVTVRNTGNANAVNVSAAVIVPVGFSLGAGETATKPVADPLAPGTSGAVSWKLIPAARQNCSDTQVNIGTLAQQTGGAPAQCAASATFKAGNNLLPEIRSASPLDTIVPGTNQTFDIDVYDEERGTLKYEWFLDGNATGTDDQQFSHTFATTGDYLVRVDIYDNCTVNGGPAVSYTWKVYVYNPTGIENPAAAAEYAILGNYPNPFNPGTVISYRLPEGRHDLRFEILDAAGRHVRTLLEGEQSGGHHQLAFDASGLPTGSYLARLISDGVVRTHRMILLK
ncbi:MAG: VWA domain-containing protein [Bacteroidota bacterium]